MTADTHSVLSGLKPLSRLDHPREMIRQFTPNWFAATMGTGILALTLPQVPGIGPALKPVGEVLWFFNIALFALFAGLYGARWVMFGHEARRIFGDDYFSYGLEPNRRTIAALCQYVHEQNLSSRLVSPDELFAPVTGC